MQSNDRPYSYLVPLKEGDRIAVKTLDGAMFVGIFVKFTPTGAGSYSVEATDWREIPK